MRPGSYTPMQKGQSGPAIWPVAPVNYDLAGGMTVEERLENRIKRIFFNHLFFTALFDNKKMTAAEVEARAREQLFILGPVTFRFKSGFLSYFLARVYEIRQGMAGSGGLPTSP